MKELLIKTERTDFMAMELKEDYQRALNAQRKEVNTVCDRLEKKYMVLVQAVL